MSFINSKFLSELIGTSFLVMVVVGSGIMASNLSNETSIILLANTIATGAGLTALIWTFIKISGAHFNPCVSLVMFLRKDISLFELCNFISAQLIGGFIGVMLANLMFDLNAFQLSQNSRTGINIFLSESIATFGLLMIILGTLRLNSDLVAPSVGLYISAGYWFTSSTSFANPAVTIARIFTDTFTGIFYLDAACFIFFQILGAIFAFKVFKSLEN